MINISKIEESPNIKNALEALTTFPAMPELAEKILALGSHPQVDELVSIIELDPGLSAQIMRQAASPFFGYRGKVDSVHDAVTRVLGMDRSLHLAFGIAAGKSLTSPDDGPVGRKAVWTHSVYSAALMEALSSRMPESIRISPGLSYLSGLLHNIGLLLLGHLFPERLRALNNAITTEPGVPVMDLERRLYHCDHADMGMWLMKRWNLPEEVVTAAYKHHDVSYRGDNAAYANLACLVDRALQRLDIGDAQSADLPADLLAAVGLREEDVSGALQNLLEVRHDLDSLASHLLMAA